MSCIIRRETANSFLVIMTVFQAYLVCNHAVAKFSISSQIYILLSDFSINYDCQRGFRCDSMNGWKEFLCRIFLCLLGSHFTINDLLLLSIILDFLTVKHDLGFSEAVMYNLKLCSAVKCISDYPSVGSHK
jgi:hypothetical protein